MGLAVGAHQPGAIDGQHDIEVLDGDIVNELIVGPLQKSGIDGHHRLESRRRQTGGEGQ